MNLYQALAEVKSLKAKLEQLSEFRRESNSYDEGTRPDFRFDDLTSQIDETFQRLTRLKLAVQSVNAENGVRVEGDDMPLARAVLELSNARAKLGYIGSLLKPERGGLLGFDRESKVRQLTQKTRPELLGMQEEYRRRRVALDSAIQEANTRLQVPA